MNRHIVYYSKQFLAMVNLDSIGRKIARLRAENGLSQEDLAYSAEVNRGYISRIENGRVAFSIPVLLKIATALKVEPYSLLLTDEEKATLIQHTPDKFIE